MTIDRDALEKSIEEKLRTIGAIHEAKSTDVIKGAWVNAPLTIVLDAILPDVQADAWDEGAHHAATSKCKFARDGDPCPGNPYRKATSE